MELHLELLIAQVVKPATYFTMYWVARQDTQSLIHNANFYLFSDIQSDYYWLAEKYPPRTRDSWIFGFNIGNQSFDYAPRSYYAWAVQSGDVSAVPIPAAAWLFISAIAGLAGAKRLSQSKGSA